VTIGSGATISPGNSPGTLTGTSDTWASGGTYRWEVNNATGAAGTNWDLRNLSGSLTISATNSSQFNIDVYGLTAGNAVGAVPNFSGSGSYAWKIADAANPVSGFAADKFNIIHAGAQFDTNNANTGVWAVKLGTSVSGGDNTELYLTYTGATSTISLTAPNGTNRADVTNQTIVEGPGGSDNLTSDNAGTNVVHVTGGGNNYISEIDGLRGIGSVNGQYNNGYVQVDTAIGTPTVVLLWLTGSGIGTTDVNNTFANGTGLLGSLDAAGGATYDVVSSAADAAYGTLWSQLSAHYSGFNALIRFNSGLSTSNAFNWDFAADPGVTVDRIAIVPEPGAFGLIGAGAMGVLATRRRRGLTPV
jgi:hypothetical protein